LSSTHLSYYCCGGDIGLPIKFKVQNCRAKKFDQGPDFHFNLLVHSYYFGKVKRIKSVDLERDSCLYLPLHFGQVLDFTGLYLEIVLPVLGDWPMEFESRTRVDAISQR
jgi:hypothetical protein